MDKPSINNNQSKKQIKCPIWLKSNWFPVAISLFALGCAIFAAACFVGNDVVMNDQSIVLVFVGILATFIVVSNYAQVKEIEEKFKRSTREQKKQIDSALKELQEKQRLNEEATNHNYINLLGVIYDTNKINNKSAALFCLISRIQIRMKSKFDEATIKYDLECIKSLITKDNSLKINNKTGTIKVLNDLTLNDAEANQIKQQILNYVTQAKDTKD